jgi:hypothetical protein
MNINAPLERELERLLASLAVEVTQPASPTMPPPSSA